MNALLMAFGGLQSIVDAPVWVVLLLKITAILLAAWLAHLALGGPILAGGSSCGA